MLLLYECSDRYRCCIAASKACAFMVQQPTRLGEREVMSTGHTFFKYLLASPMTSRIGSSCWREMGKDSAIQHRAVNLRPPCLWALASAALCASVTCTSPTHHTHLFQLDRTVYLFRPLKPSLPRSHWTLDLPTILAPLHGMLQSRETNGFLAAAESL